MSSGSEAEFVRHVACDKCGSSDANGEFSDGHHYCFACRAYSPADGASPQQQRTKMSSEFLQGEVRSLSSRGLGEAVCQRFGYRVAQMHGKTVQVADYRTSDGSLVAQKIRDAEKTFSILGDGKSLPLFGQHLWPATGKRLVVTEGELDALSVAQVFPGWPVVSVPSGASGAAKSIARNLEFVEGYDQVVFLMDMDEPGRQAAVECAALLSPGRAAIGELPLKDANEMLKANRVKELTSAVYQARTWRPGGIISGADVWDRIQSKQEPGIPYPWAGLTKLTYGQRMGTLTTWTSGTGMGKSSAVAQVAYELAFPSDPARKALRVGYVALEEDVGRAAQRFLSHRLGKLTHLPGVASEQEMRKAFDETVGTGQVWFHDHFGSTDSDDLMSKLRYLIKGCGCEALIVDHLSIIVSGMDVAADERRTIDRTMTMLRTLVEETNCVMHLVSHLKRTSDEKGAEEGGRVSLSHLRGSQSIAQLSDVVVGMERNQQAVGAKARQATVRVLKNRVSGDTGVACVLAYDKTSGRLTEVPFEDDTAKFEEETGRDF